MGYKERVSKIQNIGGLNSASFTLNGAKSPSNQESKPYSVSITKPENVKPTMNELLNGLNSPTSTKNNLSPTEEAEDEHVKQKSVRFDNVEQKNENKEDEEDDDEDFDEENWEAINEDIANVLAENFTQKNLVKDVDQEQSESINEEDDDQMIEAQISPQLRVMSGSFVKRRMRILACLIMSRVRMKKRRK